MEEWDKYANLKHIHEFSVECLLEHATEVIIVVENFKFVLIDQEGHSNPLWLGLDLSGIFFDLEAFQIFVLW